ncbi:unnamed protein product [Psylliodes chrysocephalus]|uniref:Uncharacterized protein n=1 Tax=Psylliodes chrysocephalus TaxID=3402493 RepID=A0A9P0GGG8_9CUCU|nr:unnamed protein product [Psylliodes chrysocephala]
MDDVIDHGLRLALALYGAPKDVRTSDKPAIEFVQSYRAKMYAEATNSKKVDFARIIPTVNALTEHIKCQDETLDPLGWGWELVDGELTPVTMTQEAGPEEILSNISCSCETDCGTRCGYRRSGLECSLACKHCDGNCSNQEGTSNGTENSEEEEDEEGEEEEEFEQDF